MAWCMLALLCPLTDQAAITAALYSHLSSVTCHGRGIVTIMICPVMGVQGQVRVEDVRGKVETQSVIMLYCLTKFCLSHYPQRHE